MNFDEIVVLSAHIGKQVECLTKDSLSTLNIRPNHLLTAERIGRKPEDGYSITECTRFADTPYAPETVTLRLIPRRSRTVEPSYNPFRLEFKLGHNKFFGVHFKNIDTGYEIVGTEGPDDLNFNKQSGLLTIRSGVLVAELNKAEAIIDRWTMLSPGVTFHVAS